jgi:uncharacterized protein YyaL (SSP411 family)
MEKESFENEEVAKIMNQHFVNIKVDREERPDVDKLYMAFVQASVGGGGWPMSVFLTPILEPLAGGTYFPPDDKYGRPGFKSVLKSIAEQWRTKQTVIANSGRYSLEVLRKVSQREISSKQGINVPGDEVWKKCLLQLSHSYEDDFGGFSAQPKFPQPSNFNFLFHMYARDMDSEQGFRCLQMCLHTLRKMAYGGIHDHVNCGFARYSVDDRWHVPHFEKMLYDQGQLAVFLRRRVRRDERRILRRRFTRHSSLRVKGSGPLFGGFLRGRRRRFLPVRGGPAQVGRARFASGSTTRFATFWATTRLRMSPIAICSSIITTSKRAAT